MCNKVENGAIILDRIAKGMYLWYIAKYLVALLKEKGSENENLKVIFTLLGRYECIDFKTAHN